MWDNFILQGDLLPTSVHSRHHFGLSLETTVVSAFLMYLNCFFDILLILAVFLITCTTSAFLAFSSRRLRFSSLRFFFSSISLRRASLSSRSSDSSAFLSARCCCFTFHDVFRGLSWHMLENLFFSVFQTRPDFGFPLGTSKSSLKK